MLKGLKSLIAGVVAGTALGVIFAPDKGKETRKKIADEVKKGGSGMTTLKDSLDDMGDDIKGTYKKVASSKKVQQGKEEIKKLAGTAKKTAKKAITKVKAAAKKVK